MTNEELLGIHEIAVLAKVSRAAVANWRTRYDDFPHPVVELRSGPVFRRDLVLAWLRRRKIPMTTVISTINLKGGVAKTTTTVAVAQMLAAEFRQRVLVVDLDPQTNATVMLIGDKRWKELNEDHQTVAQLFQDALKGDQKIFELQKSIQTRVGNVADVRRVALLPSSLDLIDVQEDLALMNRGRFHAGDPTDVLRRALRSLLESGEYNFVLIDCPPSLGLVTLNGLRISDYYIIPTIPDFLSTYGVPQIVRRIAEFSEVIGKTIEPLGIVATKFRVQSPVHVNQLKLLKQETDAPLFKTVIPENSEIAGAAEYKSVSTLRQKWGYGGQFDIYRALTKEILERIDVAVPQ
ncbi:MAG: AAA family ATPase [Nitrospinae bacterium]|nr:AAA family ATPase [Nitrospinota bacterium]